MPVPKVVQKQFDDAQAREEELQRGVVQAPEADPTVREDPQPNTPAAGLQVVESEPVQPKPSAELEKLREENVRLVTRLSEEDGQFGALQEQIRRQNEELQALKAERESSDRDQRFAAAREGYEGDPLLGVVEDLRQQNRELQQRLDALHGDVAVVRGRQEKQYESIKERLFSTVEGRVKDIDKVNSDPAFVRWINEVDEAARLYGVTKTRQQVINELLAGVSADNFESTVDRIVGFYNAWAGQRGEFRRRLNLQVSPEPSGGDDPPEPGGVQTLWGPQKVDQFYRELRRGAYRGREKEAEAVERDIYAARQDPNRWRSDL